MTNILYIHGMGGGADSRIPSILKDWFSSQGGGCCDFHQDVNLVCRTYPFDPQAAHKLIMSWVEELNPSVVIGESLGACHALRIPGVRRVFVSPSLPGALRLGRWAWASKIPFVRTALENKFKPKNGDRQKLEFRFDILRNYREHYREAIASVRPGDVDFAFFGTRDHYMKSGIVNPGQWKSIFGEDSLAYYEGSHYMEEEFISSLLIPKIAEILLSLQDSNKL